MRYSPPPADVAAVLAYTPDVAGRLRWALSYATLAKQGREYGHGLADRRFRLFIRRQARERMRCARAFLYAALERMAEAERVQSPMWYQLPARWTWFDVVRNRAKWGTPAGMLPLACSHGVTGWGTPMRPAGRRIMRPRVPYTHRADHAVTLAQAGEFRRGENRLVICSDIEAARDRLELCGMLRRSGAAFAKLP